MPKINLDLTNEELKKVKEVLPDKFEEDKMNWKQGNCYPTEKDAEMASLRQKSESYREKITGEYFWVWSFGLKEATEEHIEEIKMHTTEVKFNTKEACQRWYDKFGKAWEYLWENNK